MSKKEKVGLFVVSFAFVDLCLSCKDISAFCLGQRGSQIVLRTSRTSVAAVLSQYRSGTAALYS